MSPRSLSCFREKLQFIFPWGTIMPLGKEFKLPHGATMGLGEKGLKLPRGATIFPKEQICLKLLCHVANYKWPNFKPC